ncbi:MAG: hypothetical protein KZQ62_07910 [Candidatus Thiodiazotropha sp. (ex Lucinoma aequizonata)]|nr:hypothetical protein [Candidatus Thiodiazotropha sp. (ex Lucinoma aequizonata)]
MDRYSYCWVMNEYFTLFLLQKIPSLFVIIQLKNWKKCLTRFFCIFFDFKEDCLPASITIHTSSKRLAMGFFYR